MCISVLCSIRVIIIVIRIDQNRFHVWSKSLSDGKLAGFWGEIWDSCGRHDPIKEKKKKKMDQHEITRISSPLCHGLFQASPKRFDCWQKEKKNIYIYIHAKLWETRRKLATLPLRTHAMLVVYMLCSVCTAVNIRCIYILYYTMWYSEIRQIPRPLSLPARKISV